MEKKIIDQPARDIFACVSVLPTIRFGCPGRRNTMRAIRHDWQILRQLLLQTCVFDVPSASTFRTDNQSSQFRFLCCVSKLRNDDHYVTDQRLRETEQKQQ